MTFSWQFWLGFHVFVFAMLALDLGVFHRTPRKVRVREALLWSGVWIGLALLFNAALAHWFGKQVAIEFLTGYVIEKSLSVDNIFVFLTLFSYFNVPSEYQHKILFFGILGALVMRAAFIILGIELIESFHWVIYVFGAFLVVTGIRFAFKKDEKPDFENNLIAKLFRKFFRVTNQFENGKFIVRKSGKLYATPLLLVLILVEASDVIFAVDSIPAVLAVTSSSFIVYTSNVFAILGLRSLYFALAQSVQHFVFLQYGLAAILVFVGFKMVTSNIYKISTEVSLAVIFGVLLFSIGASFIWQKKVSKE